MRDAGVVDDPGCLGTRREAAIGAKAAVFISGRPRAQTDSPGPKRVVGDRVS